MSGLFIEQEEFWEWFERYDDCNDGIGGAGASSAALGTAAATSIDFGATRLQVNKPHGQAQQHQQLQKRIRTDLDVPGSVRYRILWGRYKAGKKHKVWEDDGFLTLINRIAHVSDEKGRLLEEPTLIDDIDYKELDDSGEIIIGSTQIQVQEKLE